jgi:hypothetical protein
MTPLLELRHQFVCHLLFRLANRAADAQARIHV